MLQDHVFKEECAKIGIILDEEKNGYVARDQLLLRCSEVWAHARHPGQASLTGSSARSRGNPGGGGGGGGGHSGTEGAAP